jgi:hypothetical protein
MLVSLLHPYLPHRHFHPPSPPLPPPPPPPPPPAPLPSLTPPLSLRLQWERVGVITVYQADGYCQFLGKALDIYMPQTDKAFTLRYNDRTPTLEEIDAMLLKVRQQVRSE